MRREALATGSGRRARVPERAIWISGPSGRRELLVSGPCHVYVQGADMRIVSGRIAGRDDGVPLSEWRAADSAATPP
jgi:hypothetical protein